MPVWYHGDPAFGFLSAAISLRATAPSVGHQVYPVTPPLNSSASLASPASGALGGADDHTASPPCSG